MRVAIVGGNDLPNKEFLLSQLDNVDKTFRLDTVITCEGNEADYYIYSWCSKNKRNVEAQRSTNRYGEVEKNSKTKYRDLLRYYQPDLVVAFGDDKDVSIISRLCKKSEVPIIEVQYEDS